MAFAQLTWRESLRDIEASLSANASKLYAMGFRSPVRHSTLADANETIDWPIRANVAAVLIRKARKRYAEGGSVQRSLRARCQCHRVPAMPASGIKLCIP